MNDIKLPDTFLSHFSLDQFIAKGVEYILAAIAIAAFISIIYSGFMMITSNGDAAKFATARNNIIWALIGIMVALLSFTIVRITYGVTTEAVPSSPGVNPTAGPTGDPTRTLATPTAGPTGNPTRTPTP